ncbi:MAG: hypothetical protein QOG25_3012, partial [Acetobacteraceae bacterium]|nr:hypothetical protein [Acetobacteraceae bacterium]
MTGFRQWVNQHHRPWLVSCFLVPGLLLILGIRTVDGHGFMTEPRPREEDYLKGDIRGWPIAGVPPRLTKPSCLDLPVNKQFTEIHP